MVGARPCVLLGEWAVRKVGRARSNRTHMGAFESRTIGLRIMTLGQGFASVAATSSRRSAQRVTLIRGGWKPLLRHGRASRLSVESGRMPSIRVAGVVASRRSPQRTLMSASVRTSLGASASAFDPSHLIYNCDAHPHDPSTSQAGEIRQSVPRLLPAIRRRRSSSSGRRRSPLRRLAGGSRRSNPKTCGRTE